MPKFMTYQRPTPVNKANWGNKPGGSPYQPIRKAKPEEPAKPSLPPLLNGFRPG